MQIRFISRFKSPSVILVSRCLRGGVLALLLAGFVSLAHADERGSARDHYLKGTKAYDLGLYDDAVREYMAAYQIKDDPALLFNIAQAHRLAGHLPEALRFYKTYLSKLPRAENAADLRAKIDDLQRLIEQQKRAQTAPPDSVIKAPSAPEPEARPKEALPAPAAAPVPAPPAGVAAPPAPPPADRHAGRTKKIAGLTIAGVGVLALGAGIAFAVLATSASEDLSGLSRNGGAYEPNRYSTGQTDQALSFALLGIGGAAVVAGAVVLGLGYRESRVARSLRVALTGRGLALQGRF
jgi:tetratricopeptide (TPR) repeat protein